MTSMDRRELDTIAEKLIAAAGDADTIAATVPPSQVAPTLRRLGRAAETFGRTMRALEARNGLDIGYRQGYGFLCEMCSEPFRAQRPDARYCSTRCRVAAHRRRVTTVTAPAVEPVPVVVVDHEEATPDDAADHAAGKHADLDELVYGCSACEALADEWEARDQADRKAALVAERKAEREAARARAAWLAANPEAIAWRCGGCEAEFTDADADQGQGALYECGECGNPFSRGNSADGDSNRCPDCNRFGAKLAEFACPDCNEGELEPVGEETPVPVAGRPGATCSGGLQGRRSRVG
jgi:hypothetical protein